VRALDPAEGNATAIEGDAEFAFVHDRIRETIDRRVNPVRRRAIHARLGAALEATAPAGEDLVRLATLTHHWRLARQPDRAALAAERLGDAAMRAHAYAEAADAYRAALDARAVGGDGSGAPTADPSLLLRVADAAFASGADTAADAYAAAERA
jgi:predicted ATPase